MPLGLILALLSGLLALFAGAGTAQAATSEYEINGRWLNPPPTIARGNPVVAEWRINVNDADEPPSNDPVDNVVATFELDKAVFDSIPDICDTEGVDPPSSISEDGKSLTCNFGTVDMGTALVVQTVVVANGLTGEYVTLSGTSPAGEVFPLDPILIRNTFSMDIAFGNNTNGYIWDDLESPGYVDVDLQWSLRLGKGSDPGPNEVTYRLNLVSTTGSQIDVGEHFSTDDFGCTPFNYGRADGHPWSQDIPGQSAEKETSFVEECILVETATPNVFDLTLRGINYDLANVPTRDSSAANGDQGNPLPPEWDYIASGSLYFRVITNQSGSIALTIPNPPTYTSPTGLQSPDPPGNNATNKFYTLPGYWSASWWRPYSGSGGSPWDDTYRVSTGTAMLPHTNHFGARVPGEPADIYGECLTFDADYVDYIEPDFEKFPYAQIRGLIYDPDREAGEVTGAPLDNPPPLEYYIGDVGDPDDFDCGSDPGNWTTTIPDDLSTIQALRITYPFQLLADEGIDGIQLNAHVVVEDDVPVGTDVWMFGSVLDGDNVWKGHGAPWDTAVATPTPGARYPGTNGRRDIVRIVTATPYIEKSTPESTVTPGVAADFTLTYSANGAGIMPPTVDDYEIVDTLPLQMTYEPGSADPEPTITYDLEGRQVLTWHLDGVATNTPHELTYQAVVETGVQPGTQLTNTAQSHFGGESSRPVEETVTTASNGYTALLKTADVEFIPNQNGDGVGSGSWTVRIDSFDPEPQAFTDTIDILPYIGDGRGTSYSGSYTLDDVVLHDGGTVYYTDADPATLSDDPADPDNGAPNAPSALWSTDRPANPTAVRVIGGELLSGGSFAFQVVISTDGAQPQDVYVNRAQARAEHTELVMRTSAALVVTDYVVEKSSDPESGSTLNPGDTVTYTVTVTQQGDVPAGAWFTDDLSDVLDDAVYNEDVAASHGTVAVVDGELSWEGVLPVGTVATITYSVTVEEVPGLEEDGNVYLDNQVTSPGCVSPVTCGTEHPIGYFEFSKTAVRAPGSVVAVGEVVTYSVQILQQGTAPVLEASVVDDLSAVLDDATWNNDLTVSAGDAVRKGDKLRWTGDLAVDQVVDMTYSVTVDEAGEGDDQLANVVTTADDRGVCVPAPDENPDCATAHLLGDYEVTKISDPESGATVEVGDTIEYTVTVRHVGVAPVRARFRDNLKGVLDDAIWNDDASASAGEVAYDEPVLDWKGEIGPGDVVTVTYSVTVTAEGNRYLRNIVRTPGMCVPEETGCATEHFNGVYTFDKASDPMSGEYVSAGDVVTYTVTIRQRGAAAVEDAVVVDDLTGVLVAANWNGDATATSGTVSREGQLLQWNGDLALREVVKITYSVTVRDGDATTLRNVVSSPDERGSCVAVGELREQRVDENANCKTMHHIEDAPAVGGTDTPDVRPGGVLPSTGSPAGMLAALMVGLLLLVGGLGFFVAARRRRGEQLPLNDQLAR